MKAAIITVGSELTTGRIADTNGQWAADELSRRGIQVTLMLTVDDDKRAIRDAWETARRAAGLVWITGGMGATRDDVTVEALAEALETELVRDEATARRVGNSYARRNLKPPPSAARQSLVPAGAEALPNPVGLAPGIMFEKAGVTLVMLPGVPAEMTAIALETVLPRLECQGRPRMERTLSVAGMPESLVDDRIRPVWSVLQEGEGFALQAVPGQVLLRMWVAGEDSSRCAARLHDLEGQAREALGGSPLITSGPKLEESVVSMLGSSGKTLSLAESVTGGLICARISSVPGASEILRGGWIAYRNESKSGMLGISGDLIAECGAVSARTAQEMARGAREKSGASVALSTTGWAGPGGGTENDPVGTVYVGFSARGKLESTRLCFGGGRESVRSHAVVSSLRILLEKLAEL